MVIYPVDNTIHLLNNWSLVLLVQKVDSTIHRVYLYPLDSAIGFPRLVLIYWMMIYLVDNAIHLLHNWDLNNNFILKVEFTESLLITKIDLPI